MSAQPVDVDAATSVVGRRVAAFLIDGLIGGGFNALVFFALAEHVPYPVNAPVWFSTGRDTWVITGPKAALYMILVIGVGLALFVVLPGLRGYSPAKALLGLRVVRADGRPAGVIANLIRQILWIVDDIPYFVPGLVGFIAARSRPEHRRIGDRAAGTYVVSSDAFGHPLALPSATAAPAAAVPAAGPSAAPAAPTASPPAGWYGDPHGKDRLRYWDGARWTEHTAD